MGFTVERTARITEYRRIVVTCDNCGKTHVEEDELKTPMKIMKDIIRHKAGYAISQYKVHCPVCRT